MNLRDCLAYSCPWLIIVLSPVLLQAGVKHVVLAVSYRADQLQSEMKVQAERVSPDASEDCRIYAYDLPDEKMDSLCVC